MGPRKKIKPNKAEAEPEAAQDPGQPQNEEDTLYAGFNKQTESTNGQPTDGGSGEKTSDSQDTGQATTSWYGGTWPRTNKSNPVTQVAKDSISAAGSAAGKVASEVVASARAKSPRPPSIGSPLRTPTSYLSREAASSTRSLPLNAAPTKLNITSNTNDTQKSPAEEGLRRQSSTIIKKDSSLQQVGNGEVGKDKPAESVDEVSSLIKNPANPPEGQTRSEDGGLAGEPASWLVWFTKTNNTGTTASQTPQNGIDSKSTESPASPTPRRNSEPIPSSPSGQPVEPPRSWLGIWKPTATRATESSTTTTAGTTNGSTMTDKEPPNKDAAEISPQTLQDGQSAGAPKSYGWAFWSKDDSKESDGKKRRPSNVGQLALANSPSQSKPEHATIDESKGIPDRVSKRPRPQSMQEAEDAPKTALSKAGSKHEAAASIATGPLPPTDTAGKKSKAQPKNLVIPSFRSTYRSASKPGFIQQLSRLFQLATPEPRHVEISNPRKVHRALAIGVHGYFPAPLIRSVLGQPTGTSIRFANSAASAIQRRCQEQGYSCEIEKVALEGEGKIAERLDLLWKLLLNWIDKIRKADLVMIACHSQGVPVAMMLVAKLISFGCVNSARIGVCAMAGVNMGPFIDYKSRWIGGSAAELFDFCLADSQVSKDYEAALEIALKFGVRVVYVGSIDDQLVSLESSTFGALSHPYVYRAVFVDGRVHAPDFLTHIVGFALKLRNLGISDHGLIRELSSPLAGSLYGGEGHSRIYDDEAVYDLAVEHALETTSVAKVPLQMNRVGTAGAQNPYILPFAMRGLLEEEYVKTELYGEITELIRQFDDWKPTKTVLKDVKFRLEGVRSKL